MSGDVCDSCGEEVRIAGGIANFWTMDSTETGGMVLEVESDGTGQSLCFGWIEKLPENPTAEDVQSL
jgi:hypothetical protein